MSHALGTSSNKLMQALISRHHPSWISNYHEHEMLLQENKDKKLSKEEQDLAWEVYRKTLNWEVVQRPDQHQKVSTDASSILEQHKSVVTQSMVDQKHVAPMVDAPKKDTGPRDHRKKSTNLSHLLILRSQGTKMGCTTVCGECDQEIRWEDLDLEGN